MKKKGNYIDVFSREIYPAEVLVEGGRIVSVVRIDEEQSCYIMPGFIDSHVHIESSMLVPSEFAVVAVRHGTVAVVSDPHEIANVLGKEGVVFMVNSGKSVPFKFYFGAPSCVPATPFESSGAVLDSADIKELLADNDIYFLAEMMNYPGVINKDAEVTKKLEYARKSGKMVDGHAPGLRGKELRAYIDAGISTDHEASDFEEAKEKLKRGMKILIREGSAARNLEALAPLFKDYPGSLMLCCDDIHPEMLQERHINGPVKDLLGKDYDFFDVIRAASLNPVLHYKLDVGLLRAGDPADFIVVDNLKEINVLETWIEGNMVYKQGKVNFSAPALVHKNKFNCSVIKGKEISVRNQHKLVRVIEVEDGELLTREKRYKWSDKNILEASVGEDILKIVVKDRYHDRPPVVGFVKGFQLKKGAFASSVAHDSHNIIAVGTEDNSIVKAINALVELKGGLSVVSDGETSILGLPVAGIMTDVPCGTIASQYLELSDKVKDMGSHLKAPFMTLSFMALLVIPELKLGDKGLFDGIKFEFTSLFAEKQL
ncbi:MAG: adenine deaminase [Marinilabiliaceae bacterium]|nr:adenine deaminase [Marinilabiliaceae bacterium]